MAQTYEANRLYDLYFEVTGVQATDGGNPARPLNTKIIVYTLLSGQHEYPVGETEMIRSSNNPKYLRGLRLEYVPNCQQLLKVQCLEEGSPFILGEAILMAETLANSNGNGLTFDLKFQDKVTGKVTIFAKHIVDTRS